MKSLEKDKFLEGGDGFSEFFEKLFFRALSEHEKKTPFYQNFLRRRQIFEEKKTSRNAVFGQLLESLDQKITFFRRVLLFKISKYWPLEKN